MRWRLSRLGGLVLATLFALAGCEVYDDTHSEPERPPHGVAQQAFGLSSINCTASNDTGYRSGSSFSIKVVTVDGKKVERDTANAYYVMAQAAAKAGVTLRIISGFRTMSQQQYLYNCYRNCNCNNCNLAARPGYSNHQSGHALDLNTSSSAVYNWLSNNAGRFGFKRTVPSEKWHWEWWGGGPGGGPCQKCKPRCDGSKIIDGNCGVGDCAAFGAKCVHDQTLPRCVSVFCPASGSKKVCIDNRKIGTCKNGGITVGDCGAFGAYCSEAGVTNARCVSVFCVKSPKDKPVVHDVCLPDGKLATCDKNGALQNARVCDPGTKCVAVSGSARCASDAPSVADSGVGGSTSDSGTGGSGERFDAGVGAPTFDFGASYGGDAGSAGHGGGSGKLEGTGCSVGGGAEGAPGAVVLLCLLVLGLGRRRHRGR